MSLTHLATVAAASDARTARERTEYKPLTKAEFEAQPLIRLSRAMHESLSETEVIELNKRMAAIPQDVRSMDIQHEPPSYVIAGRPFFTGRELLQWLRTGEPDAAMEHLRQQRMQAILEAAQARACAIYP